jgi:3-hydroxyisobutyrate dehydrogenase
MQKEKIGFIGIGTMGWPMAVNLVRAEYEVIVFDSDPAKAGRFANDHGGTAAASLAELAASVTIVVTMLPDGNIVSDVARKQENGAFLRTLGRGGLLIDMSSSDPIGTRRLGMTLKEHGIALVDAPVSGLAPRAIEGSLTIMIGGDDPAAVERAKPVLSTMGTRLFETGPLGSGHAMKALNNYVASASFATVSEALIIGERFGLDPAVMVEVMNASSGRSFNTEIIVKDQVLTRTFTSGFALGLIAKDAKTAADLADALGLKAPMAQLTSARWQDAAQAIGGGRDHTVVFPFWKAQAAGES